MNGMLFYNEMDFSEIQIAHNTLILKESIINLDEQYQKKDNLIVVCENFITKMDGESANNINPKTKLIELCNKYEDDFINHIEGNFIIMVLKKNGVQFFNNNFNASNFYYYLDDKKFAFAKNLKTLLNLLPNKPEFDENSISTFLQTGYSATQCTQYKKIFRLLPSSSIYVKDNKVSINHNWNRVFKFNRKRITNVEKKLDEYGEIFQSGLREFLCQCKPNNIGIFLSGGLDSTSVLLNTSAVSEKPIHTFTASFEGFLHDESKKAEEVSKIFGAKHHIVKISPEDLDYLPEMVWATEEPMSGSNWPSFLLAKEAKKHVDLVLSGDPGNSLWGKYYPVDEIHSILKNIPHPGQVILSKMAHIVAITGNERLLELDHVLSVFGKKNYHEDFMNCLSSYWHFNERDLKNLMMAGQIRNNCSIKIKKGKQNFFDSMIENKVFDNLFFNVPMNQKPVEYFGMKYFAPYLNKDVIDFINSLPKDMLVGGNKLLRLTNNADFRKFLKLFLSRKIPKKIVYSKQQNFNVPWHLMLARRPKVIEKLYTSLKKRGWYNMGYIKNLFKEFLQQKTDEIVLLKLHGYRVYCLLVFELWCKEFMDEFNYEKKFKRISLERYLID